MSKVVPFTNQELIQHEALRWIVKIDQGNFSEAERTKLIAWCESDTRHHNALREAALLWDSFDTLTILADVVPLLPQSADNKSSANLSSWGLVASCVAAVMLFIVLWAQVTGVPSVNRIENVAQRYATTINKQSKITLRDGSVMTMNASSVVEVLFTQAERRVQLLSGEVLFTVAKNKQRPFKVLAGDGVVRAVGTAFSVKLYEQKVDVTVTEGVVEVVAGLSDALNENQTESLPMVTLKEGGAVNYDKAINKVDYIKPDVLAKKLAWTSGRWIFQGERLEDVIAEANRYTGSKIEITDSAIADLQIGGYFSAGDTQSLLGMLETAFDIHVSYLDDGIIQLTSGKSL